MTLGCTAFAKIYVVYSQMSWVVLILLQQLRNMPWQIVQVRHPVVKMNVSWYMCAFMIYVHVVHVCVHVSVSVRSCT